MAQPRMKVAPRQPTYVELLRALKHITEHAEELSRNADAYAKPDLIKRTRDVIQRAEEWL